MVLDFNPFYFDFTTNFGVALFLVVVALSVFLFFKKAFKVSGILLVFLGLLLLFNNINFIFSLVFFIFGILVMFIGDK